MSVNSRENANKYYKLVNDIVDDYINKWKIRPKNLKAYFKEGTSKFDNFLLRNGLDKIEGIKQVIKDVINDRVYMEEDGVLTFESFNYFESIEFKNIDILDCFTKGIDKVNLDTEKFIADEFDTSLGHIDIVDADKHIFSINNWDKHNVNILIYNEDDFRIILHNLEGYFIEKFNSKILNIHGTKVQFGDIIDSNKFKGILNDIDFDKKVEILTNSLKKEGRELEFKKSNKYFYWIIK